MDIPLTFMRHHSSLCETTTIFFSFFLFADQDECKINNGGCSHHCKDLPMGFYCFCPDNMKLVSDSQCEGEERRRPERTLVPVSSGKLF